MNRANTLQLTKHQEELFYSHLSLVNVLVHKLGSFSSRNFAVIEKADLIQCGLIGLMEAAQHFNADRGVQFSTYASRRIKGAIQDELRRLDFVPRSVRRSEREGKKFIHTMEQAANGSIDFTNTAAMLGISVETLKEKMNAAVAENSIFVSLDELQDSEIVEITDDKLDQAKEFEKNEIKEKLVNAVQQLPEQQRIIILLYYYEELTFKEIGSILHLTESRVAQIHKAVLELMRAVVSPVKKRTTTVGVSI